jgi:hypothetical protein
MPDQAIDVEKLVARVKSAIRASDLSTRPSTNDVVVNAVDLTLKVVRDLEAGGEAKWKVPFIGLELGAHGSRKWSSTNTLAISFVPPRPRAVLGGAPQVMDLDSDLLQAITMVRASVAAAAAEEPKFELKGATVEISFGVTDSGGLSLIAKADATSDTTQTLRLALGGPTS